MNILPQMIDSKGSGASLQNRNECAYRNVPLRQTPAFSGQNPELKINKGNTAYSRGDTIRYA